MEFSTARVVIDATEYPVKMKALPTSQQATFSMYKNRNTVKYITPGGLCSFVSNAYGGSTSDRHILERQNI